MIVAQRSTRQKTVREALRRLMATRGALAGVVLSIIPLLVLFLVAGRQLVAGIMAGAVKG